MNHFRTKRLPVGKLEPELLAKLLNKYAQCDARVVVGPAVGEDAAVIDMGETYLVAKTDPITFVTDEIGHYALAINANDIACMGARPRWFLATLLLPEDETTVESAEAVFSQLSRACRTLNISLCGGHTEVTHGIDRPLVIGQMLGEVAKERLVTSAGLQVGDDVILTKGIPIEAGSIIAREKADELSAAYSKEFVERCRNLIHDPGISVVRDAEVAGQAGEVHAMHDPTEGGLATGLWELALASRVGLEIRLQQISTVPECKLLCERYGLDPLGAIASGALLIAASPKHASRIVRALRREGIDAKIIGQAVEAARGLKLRTAKEVIPLQRFERDEITKLFDSARE